MTYSALKEELHNLIETADQKKVKAVYALLKTDTEEPNGFVYDAATIAMLEKRSEDAFSGKSKTFTVQQSMENLRLSRKKHGI